MALFKCKMCGGELDVHEGMSVTECPYCGTKQTLPRLDDEKRANLYDRADHFRRGNEFDKASDVYEKILEEDKEDAEAYWSLVLCRYGVEYVEDPTTHKRVPTINRAQYTSVLIDEDYLSAIKYADGYQRDVYEAEAKVFDDIQKGILEISNKEEPFDVFICYKETDEMGRRSHDSVYAQDLYNNLTNEGYKVFFSRITLEDKLGTAYEPYIFAALNSAKVMVVLGTSANNFNSVWVKNEWSRYLALIKKGEDKTLIPVYKDMDPYDLPEEFAYLQAQDMGKVGFMQDLVRSVKKLISQDVLDERQKKGTSSVIVDTMTRRASDALANGDWETASRCYDSILDYDSQNIQAFFGKLMAEYRVNKKENLSDGIILLDKSKNYQALMKLADDELKKELENYNNVISKKIKKSKNKKITIIISVISAIVIACLIGFFVTFYFQPLSVYNHAFELCEQGDYNEAQKTLDSLDDVAMLSLLRTKVEEGKTEIPYLHAKDYMEEGKYDLAVDLLNKNEEYKDSAELIKECKYQIGLRYLESSNYLKAVNTFDTLINPEYKDSTQKLEEAKTLLNKQNKKEKQEDLENKYQYVLKNKDNPDDTVIEYLNELKSENYKDSKKMYDGIYKKYVGPDIRLYFNQSEVDCINSSDVVSNPFIIHFWISSPVYEIMDATYKCVINFPDGTSDSTEISGDQSLTVTSPSGKLTVKIYDSNGNLLKTDSVNVL